MLGAIATGMGAGLVGGYFQKESQKETNQANQAMARERNDLDYKIFEEGNQFSAAQAKIQRDFQERMSSTSYQRGMKDMKEAGLNPILAYQKGGASSPGGASGTAGTANPMAAQVQNEYQGMATTALSALQLGYQATEIVARTDKAIAETKRTKGGLIGPTFGSEVAEWYDTLMKNIGETVKENTRTTAPVNINNYNNQNSNNYDTSVSPLNPDYWQ